MSNWGGKPPGRVALLWEFLRETQGIRGFGRKSGQFRTFPGVDFPGLPIILPSNPGSEPGTNANPIPVTPETLTMAITTREVWYATRECNGIGGHPILRLDVCDTLTRHGLDRLLADTKAIAVFEVYPSMFTQLYGNSYPELDNQLADIMAELRAVNNCDGNDE